MSFALDLFGAKRRPRNTEYSPLPEEDTCDKDGASRIKAKIESFWKERGYVVQVYPVDGPFTAALRTTRVDLRSDLRNGLPKDWRKDASDA